MFLQWNHLDLNPSSWNLLWNYFKAATMYHPEPFLLQEKRSQILFCYSMVFDKPLLSLISISQTYKTFNNPSTQIELIRLEKAMAPHSSTLAWKIPWTEEPGGLQSMGSLGVGHDRATSLSLFPFMHWRRTWQPTPVLLPGESQGWGSLVGCRLCGRTESDTTEAT